MLLKKLSTGDEMSCEGDVIKIEFSGRRNVLSTCAWNGGYREDLDSVFNYDSSHGKTVMSSMKAPTLKEHMRLTASELGFDAQKTTGMCTAAQMKNVSIREISHEGVTVTAIVTGGIDVNGGRAGDPAAWYEKDGGFETILRNQKMPGQTDGTINIMLVIDARVSESVLASALMTVTEAKTAAIQELLLPSRYSNGIATGSGTDKAILIGNPSSDVKLTDAGKHSMLGEMIGKTVMSAVREALDKQTDANPKSQHSVFSRMERFGMTRAGVLELLEKNGDSGCSSRECLEEKVEEAAGESGMVVAASLYAHLLDQMDWGLLDCSEVTKACRLLIEGTLSKAGFDCIDLDRSPEAHDDKTDIIRELARRFEKAFAASL